MNHIPETKNALVLRTDFSDAKLWDVICKTIRNPIGGFRANVDFISDPEYAGITEKELISLIPKNWNHTFIFVVDKTTFSHPEHPVLVIDLDAELGRTFRVIPSEMWSIENNLSIANMDFSEFAEATDHEDIFRGFSKGY